MNSAGDLLHTFSACFTLTSGTVLLLTCKGRVSQFVLRRGLACSRGIFGVSVEPRLLGCVLRIHSVPGMKLVRNVSGLSFVRSRWPLVCPDH